MNIYKRNILNAYMLANKQDIEKGEVWYLNARRTCKRISKDTGIAFIKVCGIMSALSPATSWDKNIKDTMGFIKSPEYRCTTYKNNVNKAHDIYNLENPSVKRICRILNGQKIMRFFLNIYSSKYKVVTIDRHMISLYHGTFDHGFKETPKRMKQIRADFKEVATYLNVRPYQLQAICWTVWKRINNI